MAVIIMSHRALQPVEIIKKLNPKAWLQSYVYSDKMNRKQYSNRKANI